MFKRFPFPKERKGRGSSRTWTRTRSARADPDGADRFRVWRAALYLSLGLSFLSPELLHIVVSSWPFAFKASLYLYRSSSSADGTITSESTLSCVSPPLRPRSSSLPRLVYPPSCSSPSMLHLYVVRRPSSSRLRNSPPSDCDRTDFHSDHDDHSVGVQDGIWNCQMSTSRDPL